MPILETLVTTYGLIALISILVVAGAVWLISHFAARPGGQVSVLWGLTTYERRDSSSKHSIEATGTPELAILNGVSALQIKNEDGISEQTLVATLDDSLLIDTETQRASNDILVHYKGNPLKQLAIVTLTIGLQGDGVLPVVSLHLKRKRPGEILSALPQILGEVGFQNAGAVTPLGIKISLRNMKIGEFFRLQMLTDGLRATDFHLMQEPRISSVQLRIEKNPDWQP